jgi:hypothetical protein
MKIINAVVLTLAFSAPVCAEMTDNITAAVKSQFAAQKQDVVQLVCEVYGPNGQALDAIQMDIVTKAADTAYYVRTVRALPPAAYVYERLTKDFQGTDASAYSSKNYDVNMFWMGGPQAHVSIKGTKNYAQCSTPRPQR